MFLSIASPFLLLLIIMTACPGAAAATVNEMNRGVDDVIQAFDDLTHHGEWLGFHNDGLAPLRTGITLTLDPTKQNKAHIQGVARSSRPGTPYLFVSSAAEWNAIIGVFNNDANLMVIEMGSRNLTGERLRSNRLAKGKQTSCTTSMYADRVVRNIEFEDYRHPGSIQLVGDILAIGFEEPAEDSYYKGLVRFYNMADPLNPELVCEFVPGIPETDPDNGEIEKDENGNIVYKEIFTPGYLGLTDLADGHFLLVTGEGVGAKLQFWRSNKQSFFKEDSPDPEFTFAHHGTVDAWAIKDGNGDPAEWPITENPFFHTYQNYSLVNQADGRLFMIPGRNNNPASPILPGTDLIALYEVTGFKEGESIGITQVRAERPVYLKNDNSSPLTCNVPVIPVPDIADFLSIGVTNGNLLAAGGTYISPSRELLFYAAEHFNWGPLAIYPDGSLMTPIVRVAELRNQKVAREAGPAYGPRADAGGEYEVDEGSTVGLDGRHSQAATAAPWVQLFEHADFKGQSIMVDYDDRYLDDFDNFAKLDGQPLIYVDTNLGEGIEQLMGAVNDVKENFKNLATGDFISRQCIGLTVVDNECYIIPPLVGSVEDCKDDCDAVYNEAVKTCYLACLACIPGLPCPTCSVCEAPFKLARDFCKDRACGDLAAGVKGTMADAPDFSKPGWTDVQTAVLYELPSFLDSLGTLLESIRLSGRMLNPAQPDPPPLPPNPFAALTKINWQNLTNFKSLSPEDFILQLASITVEFASCAEDIGKAVVGLPEYLNELYQYLEDLSLSLQGFNNRASSVRWYAPSGMDIILHEKAGREGASLVLPGRGTVGMNASLGGFNDRARSVEMDFVFIRPELISYQWYILAPVPAYPVLLHDATTSTPVFDATLGDGPSDYEVAIEVSDSAGDLSQATTEVHIRNVAPAVWIDRIEDQTGTALGAPLPVLLEGLWYELFGFFEDPCFEDTHTAAIDWDDGTGNTSEDAIFQLTDQSAASPGAVGVLHSYLVKGGYIIGLTITDDDGGETVIEYPVTVADAAGGLAVLIEQLMLLVTEDPQAAAFLHKAVHNLGDEKGALYYLELNRPKKAVETIKQALDEIEQAEKHDPGLDLAEIKKALGLTAKSSAAMAILAAKDRPAGGNLPYRIEKAEEFLALGDDWLNMGNYRSAVVEYAKAIAII